MNFHLSMSKEFENQTIVDKEKQQFSCFKETIIIIAQGTTKNRLLTSPMAWGMMTAASRYWNISVSIRGDLHQGGEKRSPPCLHQSLAEGLHKQSWVCGVPRRPVKALMHFTGGRHPDIIPPSELNKQRLFPDNQPLTSVTSWPLTS